MAGAKKKKTKPAANPARGFATTSVASKPVTRVEKPDDEPSTATKGKSDTSNTAGATGLTAAAATQMAIDVPGTKDLSPEEFERQLEESELQIMVEKHAQKVRRDAQRQKSRLETDRRLLRGQAEPLNVKKWLPQELMDHILDLIQGESRFAASAETSSSSRLPPEEELTMRLWTLRETLVGAMFAEDRISAVLLHVLEIATTISLTTKDSIWGLEEALDWLARECGAEELRTYNYKARNTKPRVGMCHFSVLNL